MHAQDRVKALTMSRAENTYAGSAVVCEHQVEILNVFLFGRHRDGIGLVLAIAANLVLRLKTELSRSVI